MKRLFKFFVIVIMSIGLACGFSACQNNAPEFQFNLKIQGNFFEPKTHIGGDFETNVYNFTLPFKTMAEVKEDIEEELVPVEKETQLNDWLDKYIQDNFLKYATADSRYYIRVSGVIKEKNTGIMILVDKEFSKQ